MILLIAIAALALYAALTGDWHGLGWLGALVVISLIIWAIDALRRQLKRDRDYYGGIFSDTGY